MTRLNFDCRKRLQINEGHMFLRMLLATERVLVPSRIIRLERSPVPVCCRELTLIVWKMIEWRRKNSVSRLFSNSVILSL